VRAIVLYRPGADGRGSRVGAAGHDLHALVEAELSRALRRERADDAARWHEIRQLVGVESTKLHELRIIGDPFEVPIVGAEVARDRRIRGRSATREPERQVVHGLQELVRRAVQVRPLVFDGEDVAHRVLARA
jgi:hypothetical protein